MENAMEDWTEQLDKKWMVFEGDVEIGLEDPYSLFYFYLLVQRDSKTNEPIEHYGSIIFFHDVHAVSLSIVAAFSCFCRLFFFIARHWETNLGSCKIQNKRVGIDSRRLTPTGISIQSDWEVVAGDIMLLKVNKLDNKSNWAEPLLHISFVSHKLSPNEMTDFGFVVPKSPHEAQVLFASRSRALLLYEALLTK